MKKEDVLEFFRVFCLGRENLRSGGDIARALQISKSELRKHINRLCRERYPIASNQQGYYYATTAWDVYTTSKRLEEVEKGIRAANSGLVQSMACFTPNGEPRNG